MKVFITYLESVFVRRWWIFLGLLPEVLDILNTFFNLDQTFDFPLSITITIFIILFFISSYQSWYSIYNSSERPRVIVDYDTEEQINLLSLLVMNIGNETARNVTIEFSPNINLRVKGNKKVNDLPFLKNIHYLTTMNKIRFLFGMYIDEEGENSVLQKFDIEIKYSDSRGLRNFKEFMTLDPRQLFESNPREPFLFRIHKDLEEINSTLNIIAKKK